MTEIMDEDKYIVLISEEELKIFVMNLLNYQI